MHLLPCLPGTWSCVCICVLVGSPMCHCVLPVPFSAEVECARPCEKCPFVLVFGLLQGASVCVCRCICACGWVGGPDMTDIELRIRMTLSSLFMCFPHMHNVIGQYSEIDIRYWITIGIIRKLKLLLFFQTQRNLQLEL